MGYYDDKPSYDENNDSELHSADCFYENWPKKLHEDDEYQSFEEWIYATYTKDPKGFAEMRDRVYCFTATKYMTPGRYDKWTLVDTDRGVVYATFESADELKAFLQPGRLNRALKRIMMDKLVDFDPDSTFSFLIKEKLDTKTVQLIKGCVSAYPLYAGYNLFTEGAEETEIRWYTENNTKNEEAQLCCELHQAGMHNQMIDAHYDDAKLPF